MANLEDFKFLIIFGFDHHHLKIILKYFSQKSLELYLRERYVLAADDLNQSLCLFCQSFE